jgi:HEPN domain-containing protein
VARRESAGRPTVPTRETARIQAANYLKKAEGHLAQALEASAAGRWDTAVLLSVHAGISAADAACVAEHGVRSISQTHMDQVRLIRQLFPRDDEAKKVSNHLAVLLDRKNTVEYEGRLCLAHDAEAATKRAERLVAWARGI